MEKYSNQVIYWKDSAENNWQTALDLFKTKHYDACLFFCHLTLEKILKGLVVKKLNEPAPYIHNLEHLAKLAQFQLTEKQILDLRTITTFNIAGRYDEEKFAFYKRCTKNFTSKYLIISKDLYLCLKKGFQKN